MADNFLEKRMEDRARGKGRPFRPIDRGLPWVPRVVVAWSPGWPLPEGFCIAARILSEAGAKVALIIGLSTPAQGAAAAQRMGARYLPFSQQKALAYVGQTWGRPEAVLSAASAGSDARTPLGPLLLRLQALTHRTDFGLEPYEG